MQNSVFDASQGKVMTFLELKVPPVAQVIIMALVMYLISQLPIALYFSLAGSTWLALGFAFIGMGLGVMGVSEFKKAQTTANPTAPEKAASLVTSGVYQYTRNPMYLGLTIILLGWGLYLSSLLVFLLLPVFVIYMNRFQIQVEERIMAQNFGSAYQDYLMQVRRWF